MSDYIVGEQPCEEFIPDDTGEHECPKCEGRRHFCVNCCTDHHAGGWRDCWNMQLQAATQPVEDK